MMKAVNPPDRSAVRKATEGGSSVPGGPLSPARFLVDMMLRDSRGGTRLGLLLLAAFAAVSARAADAELPVLFQDDFEQGMDHWQPTDPDPADSVWQIAEIEQEPGDDSSADGGNHVLRVTGMSKYQPPYRSPHSIAWLKDIKVGDFELTARVQNTNPSGGNHRDLCVFWGRQSPSEFYYVHFGQKADPDACQVFIVNNAKRTPITKDEAEGTPWSEGWHDIKVTRDVESGQVNVYFDDMTTPLMTAEDTTFGAGDIGLGTFDDSGNFDDVVLRGKRVTIDQ
jgi:hypothetical protein